MRRSRKQQKVSSRQRILADAINGLLIGIQTSPEIYKEFSKLEKKLIRMDRDEKKRVAEEKASSIENYATDYERRTKKQPSPSLIKKKIKQELENI